MSANFRGIKSNGSITIFIALIITIVFSFLMGLLELSRLISTKTHCSSVTYMALESGFSHFARQLYDSYGIFGVFTSEDDFDDLLTDYINKNSNPKGPAYLNSMNLLKSDLQNVYLKNVYHLTDNDGYYFANQVISYEKYYGLTNLISSVSTLKEKLDKTQKYAPGDIFSNPEKMDISPDCTSKIDTSVKTSSTSSYKNISTSKAASLNNNISSKIRALLKSNLLLLFIDTPSDISNLSISSSEMSVLPSTIRLISSEKDEYESPSDLPDFVIDKSLFTAYICDHFSSYITNINTDIPVKYQREYILSGYYKENSDLTDSDILLNCALKLVSFRASFNMAYILSNKAKREAVYNIARSICLNTPLLSDITAFSIMSIWSYAEGIIDVRDLFQGKKVPLVKSSSTWTLSLKSITSLDKNTVSKNNGKQGYSYEDYLTMCMLLSDETELYFRTMDLIQLDLRSNINPYFSMNSCIVAAGLDANYDIFPVFDSKLYKLLPTSYSYSTCQFYGY